MNTSQAAVAIAFLCLPAGLHSVAEDGSVNAAFPFVAQRAHNEFSSQMCLGLAGSVECLEEAIVTQGIESSGDLALRIWARMNSRDTGDETFKVCRTIELRDGTKKPICSSAAIEELGFLVQDEYRHLIQTTLWRSDVPNPDLFTVEGRRIFKARRRYTALFEAEQVSRVTSRQAFRDCFNRGDKDGLVAFTGHGQRRFLGAVPTRVATEPLPVFDPKRGKSLPVAISRHAFLISYDDTQDRFHVYDSDDPRTKWPVTVEGEGLCPVREHRPHQCLDFRISWRIDDHMGNGPSEQIYCDLRPLDTLLLQIHEIVEDATD